MIWTKIVASKATSYSIYTIIDVNMPQQGELFDWSVNMRFAGKNAIFLEKEATANRWILLTAIEDRMELCKFLQLPQQWSSSKSAQQQGVHLFPGPRCKSRPELYKAIKCQAERWSMIRSLSFPGSGPAPKSSRLKQKLINDMLTSQGSLVKILQLPVRIMPG